MRSQVASKSNIPLTVLKCDCPICGGTGHIIHRDSDGILWSRDCECEIRRRNAGRIERSGLKDVLGRYTFSAYQVEKPWQRTAKQTAQKYVDEGEGKWLVIAGHSGAGKTHLATAVVDELIRKADRDVLYMRWREEAPRLKALVNDREEYERKINRLKNIDVLYIDDFFKGTVTEADVNLAFELLDFRYAGRKTTIITSERNVEEILEIDEAVGGRIYERSKGFCVKVPAENWRLTH